MRIVWLYGALLSVRVARFAVKATRGFLLAAEAWTPDRPRHLRAVTDDNLVEWYESLGAPLLATRWEFYDLVEPHPTVFTTEDDTA